MDWKAVAKKIDPHHELPVPELPLATIDWLDHCDQQTKPAVAVENEWGQAKQRVRHVYLCAGGHRHRWLWVAKVCNCVSRLMDTCNWWKR